MKICKYLLLGFILLTACRPASTPRSLPREIAETAVSPIPSPTVTPITSNAPFTYISEPGRFTIDLPAKTRVYEQLLPSVDGVFVQTPDTASFIRFEPNFALTIHWVRLTEQTDLDDFIAAQSHCTDVSAAGGEALTLDGYQARFYPSPACGPAYTTYLYLLSSSTGYVFTIQAMTPYRNLSDFIWEMLDTFSIQETTPLEAE